MTLLTNIISLPFFNINVKDFCTYCAFQLKMIQLSSKIGLQPPYVSKKAPDLLENFNIKGIFMIHFFDFFSSKNSTFHSLPLVKEFFTNLVSPYPRHCPFFSIFQYITKLCQCGSFVHSRFSFNCPGHRRLFLGDICFVNRCRLCKLSFYLPIYGA